MDLYDINIHKFIKYVIKGLTGSIYEQTIKHETNRVKKLVSTITSPKTGFESTD